MNCPICKQKIIPEFTDVYLANQKNIEKGDIGTYVKMKMNHSFYHKCPRCSEEFDIPPETGKMQCPECKKVMRPRHTDRYLRDSRECKLKGIGLAYGEIQCPLCNTIFHSTVEFVPWTRSLSVWEKTKGWFKKFLP